MDFGTIFLEPIFSRLVRHSYLGKKRYQKKTLFIVPLRQADVYFLRMIKFWNAFDFIVDHENTSEGTFLNVCRKFSTNESAVIFQNPVFDETPVLWLNQTFGISPLVYTECGRNRFKGTHGMSLFPFLLYVDYIFILFVLTKLYQKQKSPYLLFSTRHYNNWFETFS